MSEQGGVPRDEVTARDHIQVRAKLVKRVGGANNALVFGRIHFRADSDSRAAVEVDGSWWWQASYPEIGDQTGLSPKQALDAVSALLAGGWIERREGRGRAFLYRAVIAESGASHLTHRADSESDPQVTSIGPVGQTHLPSGSVTPLIDIEDKRDTPVVPASTVADVPSGRSPKITEYVGQLFEDAWTHWPRKESKKKARDRFLAVHDPRMVASKIIAHGDAHQANTPTRFVPHLTTWLNQERWTDPLPAPRGDQRQAPAARAESVIEMGQRLARQQDQKSVNA